jgi:hypothetical protein
MTDKIPIADFYDSRIKLSNWSKFTTDVGVPTPTTVSIPIDTDEQGKPTWDDTEALSAAQTISGDVFLRSDYKSGLNTDTNETVIQSTEYEDISEAINALVVDHLMMQMPLGDFIHFREHLDLDWITYSQATCHPEARFFVEDNNILCVHSRSEFPSSEESFAERAERFFTPQSSDYQSLTDEVHTYAKRVARALPPGERYSVDFVLTTNYNWKLTDMAVDALYQRDGTWRNISHHPGDCQHDLERHLS